MCPFDGTVWPECPSPVEGLIAAAGRLLSVWETLAMCRTGRPLPHRRRAPRYTVATALAGEPTAPGRRSGGAVSRNRERPFARSQSARSDKSQISPR